MNDAEVKHALWISDEEAALLWAALQGMWEGRLGVSRSSTHARDSLMLKVRAAFPDVGR